MQPPFSSLIRLEIPWMDLLRSLPIGLYLEQPRTWLHRLDPRVKLAWLMLFLITPLLANLPWRIGLVAALVGLTFAARVPWRVWRQQLGWVFFFCVLVIFVTALMPDGLSARSQPRLPANELQFQQSPPTVKQTTERPAWFDLRGWLPQGSSPSKNPEAIPVKPYRYILFKQGPVTITQRSLQIGLRLGTGYFTLLYSATLVLLTTAPEELTAALEDFMAPFRRWRIPIVELGLTLTLSLRFIPLVLEEIQNLVRSVRTRAINWKKLGFKGSAQLWLTVINRLLDNLFLRAEQISGAMMVRGFTSPNRHQVQWHELKMRSRDWIALLVLVIFLGIRISLGIELS
jgi:energy-coupling factor transport system permease protein